MEKITLPKDFKFRPGRPIRIIRHKLEVLKGKDYAEVMFFGDVHYGANNCDIEKAKRSLDYCLKNGIYVYTMGDLLEAATRYSVGSGVYEQITPQAQLEDMIEMLRPVANAGLLLNIMRGNHENRIMKETGIDVSKVMASMLKVPYSGAACWNLFTVGKQNYSIYSLHGSSGSRYEYTKLKSIIDILHNVSCDMIAMGHVHSISTSSYTRQFIDMRNKMVKEKKIYAILTGSYLTYDNSYAQEKGYPMSRLGSPYVIFFRDKNDIHVRE